jgi:Lar family restriction alleviation protein
MSEFLRKVVLKGCPFCGGKAELVKTSNGYASGDGAITDAFKVRCSHCHVETDSQKSDIRINANGFLEVRKNGAEEVAQLWNRRTNFDSVVYQESEDK